MLDLTGANLISYIIRVAQDIAFRNPRFKSTLGTVTFATNNAVNFGDTQVLVKSVTTSGNRLSPDYFMCTRHGQAILTKVEDKDGQFVEFVSEITPSFTLDPGVYYFNVDSVDEQTQQVGLTIKKYKWRQGKITNAFGSNIYFSPQVLNNLALAGQTVANLVPSDSSNPGNTFVVGTNYNTYGTYMTLLTAIQSIVITNNVTHIALAPNTDYWAVRSQSSVLVQSTKGGQELANLPANIDSNSSIVLTDQTGYQLRPNIDYNFYGTGWIQLSQWTPIGSTITLTANFRVDVSAPFASVNPENVLPVILLPGETLVPDEVFLSMGLGDGRTMVTITPSAAGNIQLPVLLPPGGYAFWEVRIDTGATFSVIAHKEQLNGAIIPGLWIAIGDRVIVNDQVAIMISPTITETYQVYGSKENLSFTLDVKANDLQTASDLSEMLKQELLVWRRTNMSADGVEIFEVSRDYIGEQRDPSATAPRYVYSLKIEASADWKVFVPLVTRFTNYTITNTALSPDYPGKLQMAPIMSAFGTTGFIGDIGQFIPSYR
jgi:hypothetical protein